jgi:hypothetical protein
MKNNKLKIFLYLSIGFYIFSLTQKSFCTPGSCGYFSGLLNLIFGWIGVLMLHGPAMTWLANPILLMSWLLFNKKPKVSFILSSTAFVLMLSFLLFDEIIDNEGGTKGKIISYQFGYWLWILSSLIMILGSLLKRRNAFRSLTSK